MSVDQVENAFGIKFVAPEDVPDAPRTNERNDALWATVKTLLPSQPGKFAQIKVYSSSTGAGQKAGQINNDRDKKFPSKEWAARYTSDRESDTSVLYLAFRKEDGSVEAE